MNKWKAGYFVTLASLIILGVDKRLSDRSWYEKYRDLNEKWRKLADQNNEEWYKRASELVDENDALRKRIEELELAQK